MTQIEAYLQHGKAGTPMVTERVDIKESILPWQARGMTYTATGYGERIPTRYMIRYCNRWRRVYSFCISNCETLFIGKNLATGTIVQVYQ